MPAPAASSATASPPLLRETRPRAVANCGDNSATLSSWATRVSRAPSCHSSGWASGPAPNRVGPAGHRQQPFPPRSVRGHAGPVIQRGDDFRAHRRRPHRRRHRLDVVSLSTQPGLCERRRIQRLGPGRVESPLHERRRLDPGMSRRCARSRSARAWSTRRRRSSGPAGSTRCRACSSSSRASRKWNPWRKLTA